jgi:hypothetical protein
VAPGQKKRRASATNGASTAGKGSAMSGGEGSKSAIQSLEEEPTHSTRLFVPAELTRIAPAYSKRR